MKRRMHESDQRVSQFLMQLHAGENEANKTIRVNTQCEYLVFAFISREKTLAITFLGTGQSHDLNDHPINYSDRIIG